MSAAAEALKAEVAAALALQLDGEVAYTDMVRVTVRPKNSSRTFVAVVRILSAEEV